MPGQFRTLVMFYVWFVSIMQVYVYQPRNVCVLSAQAAEGDDQDKEERGGACTDVSHLHLACGWDVVDYAYHVTLGISQHENFFAISGNNQVIHTMCKTATNVIQHSLEQPINFNSSPGDQTWWYGNMKYIFSFKFHDKTWNFSKQYKLDGR